MSPMSSANLVTNLAQALHISPSQVEQAIRLLDDGATVPFIARYRKEVTNGLSDVTLRLLSERLCYIRALNERRDSILLSIKAQGRLTPDLEACLLKADSKTRLEDLYLPYRPKRRSKATRAKEAGLAPLATRLFSDASINPDEAAEAVLSEISDEIKTSEAALDGAKQILMEQFSEDSELLATLREKLWNGSRLLSAQKQTKQKQPKKKLIHKFDDYFSYSEAVCKIPPHRAQALFRGRHEGVLSFSFHHPEGIEDWLAAHFKLGNKGDAREAWLLQVVKETWKLKLSSKLELELLTKLRDRADDVSIDVFAKNLRHLLLSAPAGGHVTLGLDPGFHAGVKAAVIDQSGQVLDYITVFPFAPTNAWYEAITSLTKLIIRYGVKLVSIGNGIGSRETERLIVDLMGMYPDVPLTKVVVSEAGASVYSASELASAELPDLDVTIRGAVSIARRLQNPLAELVKIDPKTIGVGQYQHDMNQGRLSSCLDGVVEDCVNTVGVDLNTASQALLSRVSGLNKMLAKKIVDHRRQHGLFARREDLLNVDRMGEKTYQQAAGFLRVRESLNPLDASSVHPESYSLVERIASDYATTVEEFIGNETLIRRVDPEQYIDNQYGLPTIQDVLSELEKPGCDPRPEFRTANFQTGVDGLDDLTEGMVLEGVVSNVTNFGAFVDIGVCQDGLVHISEMINRFVRDPNQIVSVGEILRVKVIEVDKKRRRIGLSMKLQEQDKVDFLPKASNTRDNVKKKQAKRNEKKSVKKAKLKKSGAVFNTTMADALSKLKKDLK